MRVLKPEVAKEREEGILRWIIKEYIETKKPVGSELVSKKAKLGLSSATIRSIMKKLEDEGYLHQSHTSGGRTPTDKAYRFYVDYIAGIQKVALDEKDKIERQYQEQMEESDRLMAQTSRMLAMLSHSAGFAFSSNLTDQCVKRLDFIPVAPRYILAVLVTESGSVHHWPVKLNYEISPGRLRILGSFVNHEVSGLPLKEAQQKLWEYLTGGHVEMRDVAELARKFLMDVEKHQDPSQELYIEGIGQLIENFSPSHDEGFADMLKVMEDKKRFSMMLSEKLKDCTRPGDFGVSVTIGAENELKELKNFSIISSVYKIGERPVGLLGILGPRHMEYSRMISLVNFMGDLVGRTIEQWEQTVLGTAAPAIDFNKDNAGEKGRKTGKGRKKK